MLDIEFFIHTQNYANAIAKTTQAEEPGNSSRWILRFVMIHVS